MRKRKRKSALSHRWSKLKREGRDTLRSGLGFVPGLGMALGVRDTAKGTARTTRAAGEFLDELNNEARRRYKNFKKRR